MNIYLPVAIQRYTKLSHKQSILLPTFIDPHLTHLSYPTCRQTPLLPTIP